jgi:hypothetical protein
VHERGEARAEAVVGVAEDVEFVPALGVVALGVAVLGVAVLGAAAVQ